MPTLRALPNHSLIIRVLLFSVYDQISETCEHGQKWCTPMRQALMKLITKQHLVFWNSWPKAVCDLHYIPVESTTLTAAIT